MTSGKDVFIRLIFTYNDKKTYTTMSSQQELQFVNVDSLPDHPNLVYGKFAPVIVHMDIIKSRPTADKRKSQPLLQMLCTHRVNFTLRIGLTGTISMFVIVVCKFSINEYNYYLHDIVCTSVLADLRLLIIHWAMFLDKSGINLVALFCTHCNLTSRFWIK